MVANGKTYNVRDIISFEANVMGGVHAGKPDTEEAAIAQIAETLSVGGYRASLRQLQAIARITLRALAPLASLISEKQG